MSNKSSISVRIGGKQKLIQTSAGNCVSKHIIYLALCKCCKLYYVGRTTQALNARTNLHRACFVKYVKSNGNMVIDPNKLDNYSLGIHLYNGHNLRTKKQFDETYELYILEVCAPRILDVREHMWIHRLKALTPNGLNLNNTYGLPLLS